MSDSNILGSYQHFAETFSNIERFFEQQIREARFETAARLFAELTPEERLAIAGNYCHACMRADARCQCWNDE